MFSWRYAYQASNRLICAHNAIGTYLVSHANHKRSRNSRHRQLRSIRHSVPATTFQALIVSLVLSRLDYGNAVLAGLPAYPFRRLQSMMNAAARLIYGLHHSDHIFDALISLHWLRAQERVRFKTAVLMYKATHGTAPSYLSQLVRVADLPG